MQRTLVTAAALLLLAVTGAGAVQLTALNAQVVCLPPAVIQAWS